MKEKEEKGERNEGKGKEEKWRVAQKEEKLKRIEWKLEMRKKEERKRNIVIKGLKGDKY